MKKIIVLLFVALTATQISAQSVAKRTKELNLEKSKISHRIVTLNQGYDPVAYFTQKKAVKGKSSIAATFEGVTYYFASNDNKETFKKNPSSYEPQYGGWCAYAMGANGEKVEVDPQTFKIVNGKLFLFYNAYFNNTLKSWNKDEANLNRKADANWKKFFNAN
jgi:YHS domain-containing protein